MENDFRRVRSRLNIFDTPTPNRGSVADTWLQAVPVLAPDIVPAGKIPDFDEEFALDYLNDDCLYYLYSYLELQDQINVARISKRQNGMLKYYYKVNKTLNDNNIDVNQTTLHSIKNFLIENGNCMENLILFRCKIIDIALRYCPNIKVIKLFKTIFDISDIELIVKTCPSLTQLELNCIFSFDINLQEFLRLEKIESLVIIAPVGFHGKGLQTVYSNLQHLNIWSTSILINEHILSQFAQYFNNLKTLQMKLSEIKSFYELDAVIKKMPKLEKLGIRFQRFKCSYGSLEFLKSLTATLEILEISCHISDSHMVQIGKFKSLKIWIINHAINLFESNIFWITLNQLVKHNNLLKLSINFSLHSYDSDDDDDDLDYDNSELLDNRIIVFSLRFIPILKDNNCTKLIIVEFVKGCHNKSVMMNNESL